MQKARLDTSSDHGYRKAVVTGKEVLMIKFSTLDNGVVEINTGAIDYLHDQIIIYKDNQKYTDDGHYFNEMQMWGAIEERERIELAKTIAGWYFCEFNEENEEFTCSANGKRGISLLVQTITAVCAWIDLTRLENGHCDR